MSDQFSIVEIIDKHAHWLYYAMGAAAMVYTAFRGAVHVFSKSKLNETIKDIINVPKAINAIKDGQKVLFAEIQLQSKIVTAVLDTLELAHFLCDAAGKCIKVNNKWISLTGLSERDALGHNWLLSVHSADRDTVQVKWHDMVEHGTPFEEVFRYQHRVTGEITRVKCHATDVTDDNGSRVFIIGFSRELNLRD